MRALGRRALGVYLQIPYLAGWLVGTVALVFIITWSALRLGWQDARRRGTS